MISIRVQYQPYTHFGLFVFGGKLQDEVNNHVVEYLNAQEQEITLDELTSELRKFVLRRYKWLDCSIDVEVKDNSSAIIAMELMLSTPLRDYSEALISRSLH